MKKLFITLTIVLIVLSCADGFEHDEKIMAITNGQSLTSDDHVKRKVDHTQPVKAKEPRIVTVNLEGNLLQIKVDRPYAEIMDFPEIIETPLKLQTFIRFEPIFYLFSLHSACDNMQYKTVKFQIITAIKAHALLNPFTRLDINAAAINKGVFLTTEDVKGYFVPISSSVNIHAPFLEEAEIGRLKNWLNNQFNPETTYIDFALFRMLDSLHYPEPIKEFGRLICGVLEGEAYIDFVLMDKDNRKLTVRLNSVRFGRD